MSDNDFNATSNHARHAPKTGLSAPTSTALAAYVTSLAQRIGAAQPVPQSRRWQL